MTNFTLIIPLYNEESNKNMSLAFSKLEADNRKNWLYNYNNNRLFLLVVAQPGTSILTLYNCTTCPSSASPPLPLTSLRPWDNPPAVYNYKYIILYYIYILFHIRYLYNLL